MRSDRIIQKQVVKLVDPSNSLDLISDTYKMCMGSNSPHLAKIIFYLFIFL